MICFQSTAIYFLDNILTDKCSLGYVYDAVYNIFIVSVVGLRLQLFFRVNILAGSKTHALEQSVKSSDKLRQHHVGFHPF